jgi:hypothetical protein
MLIFFPRIRSMPVHIVIQIILRFVLETHYEKRLFSKKFTHGCFLIDIRSSLGSEFHCLRVFVNRRKTRGGRFSQTLVR